MALRKIVCVFDLDGTLAHTAPSLLKAGNRLLEVIGRTPIIISKYREFIGGGTKKQVELLLEYTGGIPLEGLEFYYERFMNFYREDPISDSYLYSGVTDLLEFLKIKNIGMTICTQKNRETATVLLKKLKIYRFFDGYAFGDSTDFLKPDIRVFQYSVKGMGDANYFYIGDSFVDLSLAIKANANFIFHKNGYSGDLSQKVGVDYSFDTYDELQKFFSEYLDNR